LGGRSEEHWNPACHDIACLLYYDGGECEDSTEGRSPGDDFPGAFETQIPVVKFRDFATQDLDHSNDYNIYLLYDIYVGPFSKVTVPGVHLL